MQDRKSQAAAETPVQTVVPGMKYRRPSVTVGLWIIKHLEKFISLLDYFQRGRIAHNIWSTGSWAWHVEG